MELPAYHYGQQDTSFDDNLYEEIDTAKDSSTTREKVKDRIREKTKANTAKKTTGGKQKGVNIVLAIAIVATLAIAVIAIIVSVLPTSNSNQEIQSLQLEIANLRELLNQTGDNSNQEIQSLQLEIANLREMLNQTEDNSNQKIQSLQQIFNTTAMKLSILQTDTMTRDDDLTRDVQYLNITVQQQSLVIQELRIRVFRGTFEHPASSCSDIPQDSPSGEYWIQTSSTNSPVQVYCDMTRTCCSTTGGWTRVANLDMTDSNQQCPDGFRLETRTTAPLRTCGRPGPAGCVSTTFPVHGIEYSHVCGRVTSYQDHSTNAFWSYYKNRQLSINDNYVDGVSLTHGQSPRQHIWTFAAAIDETRAQEYVCPCTQPDLPYTGVVPPFIGQDYFCETGSRNEYQNILYSDDPLWNGQGCGGNSTCCSFNNPPWFCKQLPQPTTDDIELRLCRDQDAVNEDSPLEIVDIYIK